MLYEEAGCSKLRLARFGSRSRSGSGPPQRYNLQVRYGKGMYCFKLRNRCGKASGTPVML